MPLFLLVLIQIALSPMSSFTFLTRKAFWILQSAFFQEFDPTPEDRILATLERIESFLKSYK